MAEKNVVIIGGGLSGMKTAMALKGVKNCKITIVQAESFCEWQIAATLSLTRPDTFSKAVAPLAPNKLPGVTYVIGKVTQVNEKEGQILLAGGQAVMFDFCVLAIGFASPVIKPALGASFGDRNEEVRQYGAAIRVAKSIGIVGAGPVGVELAGDVVEVVPKGTRVVLVGRVLPGASEKARQKAEAKLKELGVEVLEDLVAVADGKADAPHSANPSSPGGSTQPGSYPLKKGGTLDVDVLLPAYGQNQSEFLADLGILDQSGNVVVNEFLQCPAAPKLFGVGCTNLREFRGIPKIEPQAKTVAANLRACLAGQPPATKHKEGAPFMRHPPMVVIGHQTWAMMDTSNMPPPVACCARIGFPCCPPPVCWCCLPPCCCGGPCADPEGKALAGFLKGMAHKSAGFHNLRGFGEPPEPGTEAGARAGKPTQLSLIHI